MGSAHTWREALPGQTCQECRAAGFTPARSASWVLVIGDAMSGEELLCHKCACWLARHNRGLSAPTTSSADVDSTSAQTSEAAGVVAPAASELTTEVSCDE